MGIPIDTKVPGHQSAEPDRSRVSASADGRAPSRMDPAGRRTESGEATGRSALDVLARAIAVVGVCGLAPRAPGTVGSLAAVAVFVGVTSGLRAAGVAPALSLVVHAAIVLLLCVVGTWAAGRAERIFGRSDDGRIVIDEVAGQWIALLPVGAWAALGPGTGPGTAGGAIDLMENPLFPGSVVTAFVLFRVFDVWKPGWVGRAERRFDGGWGVMADDLVAGCCAAVLLVLLIAVLGPASDPVRLQPRVERGPVVLGGGTHS